jgi:hypothetical protein
MEQRKLSRGEAIVEANRDFIAAKREQGVSWHEIAFLLGIGKFTITMYSNPKAYEREKERKRRHRERERQALGIEGRPREYRKLHEAVTKVEIAGELPPPDTRDLTGRILGDPLPGRSYLDRMRAQQEQRA